MPCLRSGGVILCYSTVHTHTYNGKTFRFEAGWYGPWPVRRDGEPFKIIPSTFWPVFEDWEKLQRQQAELHNARPVKDLEAT